MIKTTELSTPVTHVVLEDLVSTNKDVIDLLGHITCIAVPHPVMQA